MAEGTPLVKGRGPARAVGGEGGDSPEGGSERRSAQFCPVTHLENDIPLRIDAVHVPDQLPLVLERDYQPLPEQRLELLPRPRIPLQELSRGFVRLRRVADVY